MSAIDRNSHFETSFVATVKVSPRTLFSKHGKAYQVCGEDAMEIGELVVGRSDRRSEITKGNLTDVFAEDDEAFYSPGTNKVYLTLVAANAAGAGSFSAGKAQFASSATEPTLMVMLNF